MLNLDSSGFSEPFGFTCCFVGEWKNEVSMVVKRTKELYKRANKEEEYIGGVFKLSNLLKNGSTRWTWM